MKNYISLGYFCDVARDLERMGLRNQSSPFDWGISSFPEIIDLIDKKFDGFLEYDNLSQCIDDRSHYLDEKYHFYFFHDFDRYVSLNKQFNKVKEKYDRRINRFLDSIHQPTTFIRYISSEKVNEQSKSLELEWIESNLKYIMDVIKGFNSENEIIFIGDESVHSDVIKVYNVKKDEGKKVSKHPIYNNEELFPILSGVDFPGRQENIERYEKKEKKKNSPINRRVKKLEVKWRARFKKEYIHAKTNNPVEEK